MEPRQLPQKIRQLFVEEIEQWQKEGVIPEFLAETLQNRYNFDFNPPTPPEAPPVPEPIQTTPPPPPKPRLTLAQALMSETSIKIALYLGAFFVIAASLILAALVASLRLPILISVTILFGSGAIALKRRLPQPSFILYLVFSTLLPITAGVLADLQNLTGRTANVYWLIILAGMTLIWAFSTRLYTSRFFSLASLLALDAAVVMAVPLMVKPSPILFLLILTISSLVGLVGVFLLKRWQGKRMALPVFILLQIQQGIILCIASILLILDIINSAPEWGLFSALTWLLSAAFAVFSSILFHFILYPWIVVGTLMPIAWLVIVRPDSGQNISPLTLGIWGMLFAINAEIIYHARKQLQSYVWPLSAAAILLLLVGAVSGLNQNNRLGFGLFVGTSVLLSILHAIRKQAWLWTITLGFSLGAYFIFFQLPFAEPFSEYWPSQLAGATTLLLLPDMLLPPGKPLSAWRWPLRGWAIVTAIFALLTGIQFYFSETTTEARIILFTLGILGVIYLAYALRIRRPELSILFTVHVTLALVFGLRNYNIRIWLPILTGLAVLFYTCGILLRQKHQPAWSNVMRWSSLVLAVILTMAAFSYHCNDRALYVFFLGSLFLIETFQTPWVEIIPPLVYSLALGMALYDVRAAIAFYPAGIAIIFLGLDLLYTRLKKRKGVKWATRLLGGFSAVITPIFIVLSEIEPMGRALVCTCLAVFFVIQALYYRQPRLGYAAPIFCTLAVLFADLKLFETHWLWSMIITAMVFYGLSLVLGHMKQPGWIPILSYSGLGLASMTALSAPFERSGLIASLPVAIAASLWAVEAFRGRNVWFGFPANGLYLMAYFMILSTLKVDQAQFYSVGAAALGILMHYLLVRTGSRTGAFLTGMFSQLVLLSATYIQMVGTENVLYFAVLFFQSMVVLAYGIIIRSRSLVITPIAMIVIGVVTVVFSILRDISTVILIGCTGIGLILLAITALLLRERIANLRKQIKDWRA